MHRIDDSARRRELADFLRSRRERLSPLAAGLRSNGRRRTPGLRREEVAELAGIGTAWYTWLEQARDIRPSEGALRHIARALQLDDAERRYLYELATERAPRSRRPEVVTPGLSAVLHAFSGPAYVKGQRWDLLEWNEEANVVLDLEHIPRRNLLANLFTPESRRFLPNWEHMARQHVAMFRADNAGLLEDPWIHTLVDELKATSAEFAAWWSEHAVSEAQSGHKTYQHPLAGELRFDFTSLVVCDAHGLRLIVSSPTTTSPPARRRLARHPRVRAPSRRCARALAAALPVAAVPDAPLPGPSPARRQLQRREVR